jgi:hypothetical protein
MPFRTPHSGDFEVCKTEQPPEIQTCYCSPDFGNSAFPVQGRAPLANGFTGKSKERICDEQLG